MKASREAPTRESVLAFLEDVRRHLELAGENPFKVRAFEKAEKTLGAAVDLLERLRAGTLEELPGIGTGIAGALTEWFKTGRSSMLEELQAKIPPGLAELTQVPGLGTKRARQVIDVLGIQTLGELEYACRENRLLSLPGFGAKLQGKILEYFRFRKDTEGMFRLVDAEPLEGEILGALRKAAGEGVRVEATGELRRKLEIVRELRFLAGTESAQAIQELDLALVPFRQRLPGARISVSGVPAANFEWEWAHTTATEEHWKAARLPLALAGSEEKLYTAAKLPWIAPELREGAESVALARRGGLAELLDPETGVQGVFHVHTTRSDGSATLEEMVARAEELGYRYIGVSDHSQSAHYAGGLKADALKEQEREVRECQEKHPGIRVFWGIESDILADGSLDYPDALLKRFDFVIASVHQRFKLDRAQMTERIVRAIRNPYTRFIGHLTGRLLLGRAGYELDLERVAREAAKADVAIELNANPARLDVDWRHGALFRERGVKTSVNPDAHGPDGFADTRFGVLMARKALFPRSLIVNSWDVEKVEAWLRRE